MSGIINANGRLYVQQVQARAHSQIPIEDRSLLKNLMQNEEIDPGFLEILQNLLTINPYFRWTAAECLAHPIFDDLRCGERHTGAKILLDVDKDDAYNYKDVVST